MLHAGNCRTADGELRRRRGRVRAAEQAPHLGGGPPAPAAFVLELTWELFRVSADKIRDTMAAVQEVPCCSFTLGLL